MAGLRWDPQLRDFVWQTDVQQYITMHNAFTPDAEAFRYYEDGTESGATAIDTQGTNIGRDVSSGNVQFQLRVQVGETGTDTTGAVNLTLEYEINNSGTWVTVTTSSAAIQVDTGSSLTDGGATTDRLTGGTGTFVGNGIQESGDGVTGNMTITAGNHIEVVFGCLVIASGVADSDLIDFRVVNGGSTFAATMGQPRITVTKTAAATDDVEAMAANSHLGAFWMPKALSTMIPYGMRFSPQAGEASGSVVAITQESTGHDPASLTTYTFSGLALGTPAGGRVIAVVVHARGNNALEEIDTATVAGNSTTKQVETWGSSGSQRANIALFTVVDEVNSSGDVVVTALQAKFGMSIEVYSINGADSATPSDSAVGNNADPINLAAITTVANGGVIAGFTSYTTTGTVTWSNITEDRDTIEDSTLLSSAFDDGLAGGSLSVSVDESANGVHNAALVATWDPA